jgi:hypothetical protein
MAAGSNPNVVGFFSLLNPSNSTMTLELTEPLWGYSSPYPSPSPSRTMVGYDYVAKGLMKKIVCLSISQ